MDNFRLRNVTEFVEGLQKLSEKTGIVLTSSDSEDIRLAVVIGDEAGDIDRMHLCYDGTDRKYHFGPDRHN